MNMKHRQESENITERVVDQVIKFTVERRKVLKSHSSFGQLYAMNADYINAVFFNTLKLVCRFN